MTCDRCRKEITPPKGYGEPGYCGGTGYGYEEQPDGTREIHCYGCCAVRDRERMDTTGCAILYLAGSGSDREVINWPGTLRYDVVRCSKGRHNMAGVRYDVAFRDHLGWLWSGVQYGDNTEVVHCRRLKKQS